MMRSLLPPTASTRARQVHKLALTCSCTLAHPKSSYALPSVCLQQLYVPGSLAHLDIHAGAFCVMNMHVPAYRPKLVYRSDMFAAICICRFRMASL